MSESLGKNKNMVMGPEKTHNKNACAGENLQQFTALYWKIEPRLLSTPTRSIFSIPTEQYRLHVTRKITI
jgi:hypothetical protein